MPVRVPSPQHHTRIARRGIEGSERLGRYRWIVE
ncbi:hypothetical protein FHR71_002264 [Methylobacterium sp. RAS18]|nr:hypothetical protein [Methylobacterium sp. RAS18]